MSDTNRPEAEPVAPAAPDPQRPGEVRWKEVFAGFGTAFAVMFGIRVVLWGAILVSPLSRDYAGLTAGLVAWYVPIPVLVWLIWHNARRGRKGRAIGMAIYAGLAALLVTACWSAAALFGG